jgi:hypothetical protein
VLLTQKGALLLLGVAAFWGEFDEPRFRSVFARWPQTGSPTLSSHLSTWDIAHYLRLSQDGYDAGSSSCAFYPLWPATIRTATDAAGGRPVLTSLLLTNALSLVGLWLFYRLVERRCGAAAGRDSLIVLLVFPGALFFSFPYTESLYLVILMLFFWGLELERRSWVAVAGFLLPLTRAVGIFIVLPLAWYLFEQWRKGPGERVAQTFKSSVSRVAKPADPTSSHVLPIWKSAIQQVWKPALRHRMPHGKFNRTWLLLLCPLLGHATYFGTMYAWTGNAFEGFEAQKAYPNSPSINNMFDFPAFWNAFINVRSLDGMMDSTLDRGFFLLFLALLPAVWKLNKTWFWYTLPTGLVPAMTSYFMSYRRYIMVLFPLFIVLAQVLAKGPRWMFWYYVILLAALQAWAVTRFVNFNWAG